MAPAMHPTAAGGPIMDRPEEIFFTESFAGMVIILQVVAIFFVALVMVIGDWVELFGRTRGRWSFRCALAGHDVEVEFAERRFFGFPRPRAVCQCSAFDPPTAVGCRRQCLDRAYRTQWEYALPIVRPGASRQS